MPSPPVAAPRQAAERSAVAAIAVLCLAAWAGLVVEAVRSSRTDDLFAVLCGPSALAPPTNGILGQVPGVFTLWLVMNVAMMLPTSVPMVLGFVDTLAERRRPAPGWFPLVLIGGYGAVWAIVSGAAALIQVALTALAARTALPAPAAAVMTGALVGFAGLYQFSDLKLRFLGACRHPVAALPPGRDGAGGVFRLGVDQAIRCVGCCAAVMGLMLVAGMMNLAWMGLFALAMTVERIATGPLASRLIGFGLLAAGVGLAVSGVGAERIVAALLAR